MTNGKTNSVEFYRKAIPVEPEVMRDGSLVEQFELGPLLAFTGGVELSIEDVEKLANADPEMESVAEVMRREGAA